MGISIIIPVGSNPKYFEFLPECLDSILSQWQPDDEIILVDDAASVYNGLARQNILHKYYGDMRIRMYENPWRQGCASSWNTGVSISHNEHCILMGSDDLLLPGCLEACREVINNPTHDPLGYYNLTCVLDTGEVTDLHNNAAMVSRELWKFTGGFGPSAFAAPDAWLISILLGNAPQHLHQIKQGTPLYYVRTGDHQDTPKMAGLFNGEVISIRDKETARFSPYPEWAKGK